MVSTKNGQNRRYKSKNYWKKWPKFVLTVWQIMKKVNDLEGRGVEKGREKKHSVKKVKHQHIFSQSVTPKENFRKMDLTQPKSEQKKKTGRLKMKIKPPDKTNYRGGSATRDIRSFFEEKKWESLKNEGGGKKATIEPIADCRRRKETCLEKVGPNEPLINSDQKLIQKHKL